MFSILRFGLRQSSKCPTAVHKFVPWFSNQLLTKHLFFNLIIRGRVCIGCVSSQFADSSMGFDQRDGQVQGVSIPSSFVESVLRGDLMHGTTMYFITILL